MPLPQEGAEAPARGLPLLGVIHVTSSARARCAISARAAPPALLEANDPPLRRSPKPDDIGPWCVRTLEGAGNDGRGTRNQDDPGREICDAAVGVQNNEDGDAAREPPDDDNSKESLS